MHVKSLKSAMRWATICIIISSLLIIGCSNQYNPAAPISNVQDISRQINTNPIVNRSSGSTPISSSPKNIFLKNQNSSTRKPLYQIVIPEHKTNNDSIKLHNRNYDNIPQGSYSSNTYTVKQGDTLFYIAWITGNNYRALAQLNNIKEPDSLRIGQVINIDRHFAISRIVTAHPTLKTSIDSQFTVVDTAVINKQNLDHMLPRTAQSSTLSMPTTTIVSSGFNGNSVVNTVGKWQWPAEGKVIDSFSNIRGGGNRGIDISGSRGQPVVAAAAGKVVYSGNALRGYGNLIILRHNDDYLSAYAHNDTILVRDQENVKAGQKIATMGNTGTSSVKLHFEIRYKGKSVNPLLYISQQ
ncbi:MAG: murein hydrolase activator NlpD [Candidatus Arsenophonus melophagi]|nr:murein hydrolase activator NlpD [Candidatus Arsenophonus melophagi]